MDFGDPREVRGIEAADRAPSNDTNPLSHNPPSRRWFARNISSGGSCAPPSSELSSPLTRRAATFDAHTGIFSRFRAFKCLEQGVASIMRIVDDDAAWEDRILERRRDGVDRRGAAFTHSFRAVVTKR